MPEFCGEFAVGGAACLLHPFTFQLLVLGQLKLNTPSPADMMLLLLFIAFSCLRYSSQLDKPGLRRPCLCQRAILLQFSARSLGLELTRGLNRRSLQPARPPVERRKRDTAGHDGNTRTGIFSVGGGATETAWFREITVRTSGR